MRHEEARGIALAMLAALGTGWVMDLIDNHGFTPRVTNGPCAVSYSENSKEYAASIRLGSIFSGYSADPVCAMDVAFGKVTAYVDRITGERDAILAVMRGTYADTSKVKP